MCTLRASEEWRKSKMAKRVIVVVVVVVERVEFCKRK
jgi:hypothetical protein